ncbi:MAG: hypothetical protein F4129_06105 [Acidimicrobiia bacterium]|nr:hypothetical protein [Acidimicrobiia bacterium]
MPPHASHSSSNEIRAPEGAIGASGSGASVGSGAGASVGSGSGASVGAGAGAESESSSLPQLAATRARQNSRANKAMSFLRI